MRRGWSARGPSGRSASTALETLRGKGTELLDYRNYYRAPQRGFKRVYRLVRMIDNIYMARMLSALFERPSEDDGATAVLQPLELAGPEVATDAAIG